MKLVFSTICLFVIAMAVLVQPHPLHADAAGMPEPLAVCWANTYDYRTSCPPGGTYVADKWSFYKCECTSYVADKLNEQGIPFNNTYRQPKGYKWGDAGNWVTAAKRANIRVDMIPTSGAAAVFTGHVAYVQYVNTDGSIDITEYNFSPPYGHQFGQRTIAKKDFAAKKIIGFVHF